MKPKKKTIDNVTTEYLDMALRMCGYNVDLVLIDKIIDLVELIEEKGGDTHLMDICKLKAIWENRQINEVTQ